MGPTIFLDIDGVLLTGRAWAMSVNARARKLMELQPSHGAALATFDKVAVELVNRLCRVTSGTIVIASGWLHRDGEPETRRKLLEQGLDPGIIHPVSCRPHGMLPRQVAIGISDWRRAHRIKPLPSKPAPLRTGAMAAESAVHDVAQCAWREAEFDIGPFVVLSPYVGFRNRVQTTTEDGISCLVYRVACRALGGTDPEMSVHAVEEADWQRLLAACRGRAVSAAHYLESSRTYWRARAVGKRGSLPEAFWVELAKDTTPFQPTPNDPRDMDF